MQGAWHLWAHWGRRWFSCKWWCWHCLWSWLQNHHQKAPPRLPHHSPAVSSPCLLLWQHTLNSNFWLSGLRASHDKCFKLNYLQYSFYHLTYRTHVQQIPPTLPSTPHQTPPPHPSPAPHHASPAPSTPSTSTPASYRPERNHHSARSDLQREWYPRATRFLCWHSSIHSSWAGTSPFLFWCI